MSYFTHGVADIFFAHGGVNIWRGCQCLVWSMFYGTHGVVDVVQSYQVVSRNFICGKLKADIKLSKIQNVTLSF